MVQVAAHLFVQVCRQAEVASYVVADTEFHYSSYYKKILAKQLEMNDKEGDSSEYLHEPRSPQLYPIFRKNNIILCIDK